MPSPVAAHPTCSVVVPVKDDAAELRGLLDALARQTVPPLEIIVVDNGSVDDSARIAAQAGCRVLSEPRPGIAAAASIGYDAARGDLILRCDADSRPGPTWVAAHRAAYQAPTRDREVVAVTGPARFRLPFPLDIVTSAERLPVPTRSTLPSGVYCRGMSEKPSACCVSGAAGCITVSRPGAGCATGRGAAGASAAAAGGRCGVALTACATRRLCGLTEAFG